MEQNYKNHVRYYFPHHVLFYGSWLLLTAGTFSIINRHQRIFVLILGAMILIGWLAFMLRQHYALGNQNRIVRLEMRLRYYILTQKRLEPIEAQLTFKHIAALRFAPDEELVALIDRAVSEKLSPDEIKKSIKNWLPDHMRL